MFFLATCKFKSDKCDKCVTRLPTLQESDLRLVDLIMTFRAILFSVDSSQH